MDYGGTNRFMRLGVDFGTTNSSVAIYDGETLHAIVVDALNDNPDVMPSLIYLDRERQVTVGTGAANLYLKDETGRKVRWRQREAGEFEVTVASFEGDPIDYVQQVSVLVDEGAKGRLLQSIKTALFNQRYEGTQVFETYYPVDELIAIILRNLKQAAEQELGTTIEQIVLGRPVRFSHNPSADSRAEAILLKAAHLAGFKDVQFQFEPVGVTHLFHLSSAQRRIALVFDFGGGTLDLTIARVGGDEDPDILAIGGALIGGDDLDRRIMELLLPYFGAGDDTRLPPEMIDRLRAWQTMPELSQPSNLERIRTLRKTSSDPTPFMALETLVTRNLGYKLFTEIERVKKHLSVEPSAHLRFDYEAIQIDHTLTRRRFEKLINEEVMEIRDGIHDVLQRANLQANDIDVVLRTGGSSLIPAFYKLLADIFGEDKLHDIDPLVSVVGGFAVRAYDYEHKSHSHVIPASLIENIRSASGHQYDVYCTGIDAKCYMGRDYKINRIPSKLNHLPAIRMVNLDKDANEDEFLRFTLCQPARVYIAYESTVETLPKWVTTFSPQNLYLEINDDFSLISRQMHLYAREFPAGEVILGGNMARGYIGNVILHYLVMVEPI